MEQHHSNETQPQNTFNSNNESRKSISKTIDLPENTFSGDFECNICLDSVQDPVVTLCGHLYCWPCIYKWIHHQNPETQTPKCPVCKTEVSENTIVPLYGRGQTMHTDTDTERKDTVIPRRPTTPSAVQLGGCGFQRRVPPRLALPDRGGVVLAGGAMSLSPTIAVLGEMVSGRILGELGSPLFGSPNSYSLAGISTRRARRQVTRADRSLSRIYGFLFCCIILCLLLFT